jgi:MbtH protein
MSDNTTLYKVVTNHAKQYYIWPAEAAPPPGWSDAGCVGTKVQCLSYIAEVWPDTRLPDSDEGVKEKKI